MGAEIGFFGLTVANIVIPAILIALGAFATWLGTSYFRRQDVKLKLESQASDERQVLRDRVTDLETQLQVLRESVQPISMAFQQILIKELTHFHEVRTDDLLAKIGPPYMLSEVEENELVAALDKRIAEAGTLMTESEINAAKMLPMLIKRVKAENALGIPPGDTDLLVVAVPANGSGK